MDILDTVNPYLHGTVFCLALLLEAYVFISLRFKLDKAAYLIALSYLIVMLIRIVPSLEDIIVFTIIWPIAGNIIWAILFYFVFEMKQVQAKLVSDTFEEYKENEAKIKKREKLVIGVYTVFYILPMIIVYYITKGEQLFYRKNFLAFIILIIFSRVLKCFIDIYMGLTFISLFNFFVRLKRRALNSTGRKLTRFNNFIIYWTYFNFSLKAFNAFCVLTILTLYQALQGTNTPRDNLNFIYYLTMRTFVSIIDLLNLGTIMYLYYYQGMRDR
jgi:hypothetical protein